MAQFPCLPIWTDAWVADTYHLNLEQEGAYFRLVRVMWRTPGCRVPNDNQWLAKHMLLSVNDVVEKIRPIIAEFCRTDGNWLYQKRLRGEFVKRFEFGQAQSARRKHRKNKKKDINPEITENQTAVIPPSLPLTLKERVFPTAATTVDNSASASPKKQPNRSARSLASAPDVGALTREPDNKPAEPKKPEEMTLAEINVIRYGRR